MTFFYSLMCLLIVALKVSLTFSEKVFSISFTHSLFILFVSATSCLVILQGFQTSPTNYFPPCLMDFCECFDNSSFNNLRITLNYLNQQIWEERTECRFFRFPQGVIYPSGEGILVYDREDIASNLLSIDFSNREDFSKEINLRKKKWMLCFLYNPHNSYITTHTEGIGKVATHSLQSIKILSWSLTSVLSTLTP